jgi:hypothetical protein
MYQIAQAAEKGTRITLVSFRAIVSPVATVARLYVSSVIGAAAWVGGTSNSATNTWLVNEFGLPAVTLSQTLPSPSFNFGVDVNLPGGAAGGYRLIVSFGTSTGAAGTGYTVFASGLSRVLAI